SASPLVPDATDSPDKVEDTFDPSKLDPSAPVGSVTPPDGYGSELPDDDTIPDEVAPDPCADPRVAANLPGIVVGATLKNTLRVKLGDCIEVTSPTIGFSFFGGAMRPPVAKEFRVTGVFEAGFDQYASKLVSTD